MTTDREFGMASTSGEGTIPHSPYRVVVVGNFMSRKEFNETGRPWSDGNAANFRRHLASAGINPSECFFTNVFNMPPPGRYHLDAFFTSKKLGVPHLKPVRKGKYLDPQFLPELRRLWAQIRKARPHLIIAAGDAAIWATCRGTSTIDAARGRVTEPNSEIAEACQKVLPTYATAQLPGSPELLPVLRADLSKAAREAAFPEFRRPSRHIYIPETLEDLEIFHSLFIEGAAGISSDIETKGDMITCISFATSPREALVVPFFSESAPDGNYWPDKRSEYLAWVFCRRVLKTTPGTCGHNYQFDMQHELRSMGIPNPRTTDDTMLLHHVLQPEMKKGLGFLGSIYTDEIQWKGMHKHSKYDKTVKQGEDE